MEMNLGSILRISASRYPHREAVIFENDRTTFIELQEKVNQRAHALLSLGVKKGDHVATLASNGKELVETIFAVLRLGAVLVPLNIRLSPRELSYIIDHADVSTLIFRAEFEGLIRQVQPTIKKLDRFLSIGENPLVDFIDFNGVAARQPQEEPWGEVREEDVAMILYTAGTTGNPKGVVTTHKSWLWSAMNGTSSWRIHPGIKSLTVYPLFHAAGFFNFFISILNSVPLVMLQKFDPVKFLELIEKEKINRVANPPAVYNMMLQARDIGKYNLGSKIGRAHV
jgi:acyl-CoA synthetase (AMP-forming)/AMP-acid ligase II